VPVLVRGTVMCVEGQTEAQTDGRTELTITLRNPGIQPITRVLREPGGGDHPHPREALAALAAADDPFAPVPPGTIATTIYGGPQTATVVGTYRGLPVNTTFCRTDGAQLHRWSRVAPLLEIDDGPDA
jgi:hypothetical protein